MSLRARLWLGLFPVLLGLVAVAAVVTAGTDHESHPVLVAVLYPVMALSFVVGGLVAWTLRPGNGTGRLMAAVGFLWTVNSLWESDNPYVFGAAGIVGSLFLAAFVHVMLAFPEGRLRTRFERRLIASLWLTALLASALPTVFSHRVNDCKGCPANPLVIVDRPGLADALEVIFSVIGVVIFFGVVVLLVRRWRRASPAQRRILGPVYLSGGVTLALVAALFAIGTVSSTAGDALAVVAFAMFGAVPLFFLAGLLRTRLYRAAARLLREVPDEPTPEQAQTGLRNVLGDPTLELLTWVDERGGYVDVRGAPVEPRAGAPHRVTTTIDSDGRPLAALVHDPALLHEPGLLDEVVSAARIALEKDRGLQALRRTRGPEPRAARRDSRSHLHGRARRHLPGGAGRSGGPRPPPRRARRPQRPRRAAARGRRAVRGGAGRRAPSNAFQTIEYRLVIDGEERDFEARMVPGGEDEVVVIVRDFTDRSRLEEQLSRMLRDVQHEQEFTRTVVNTAPIVLMLCDDRGGIVRFNDTTERLFGRTDDERVWGRMLWDAFVADEDREAVEDAFRRVHPLRPVEIQARWLTEGGDVRVVDASIAHIIDGQGLHRRIVAGLDVTDLVRAAGGAPRTARLPQRHRRCHARACSPWSTRTERSPPRASTARSPSRPGTTTATAVGRRFWDLVVPPELVPEFETDFAAAVADGVPADHETAWIGVNGEWRLVEWSCRPLPQIGKHLICGLDITERKLQEDELRASRARIVEAGDAERRRLERNLHDGAQQRLVSLSLALRLAQAQAPRRSGRRRAAAHRRRGRADARDRRAPRARPRHPPGRAHRPGAAGGARGARRPLAAADRAGDAARRARCRGRSRRPRTTSSPRR